MAEQNADRPSRKHPAHGVFRNVTGNTIVLLTVCTDQRVSWLASPTVQSGLLAVWETARAWLVGRYVLMPDHLRLFAVPGEIDLPFDNWVRYWKSQYSKRFGVPDHQWQVDHWDRRLRREAAYDDAWEYVRNNPVRAGLVTDPDDWRYQGVVHEFRWD
jgi:REP element-mobilizing transposase RayT